MCNVNQSCTWGGILKVQIIKYIILANDIEADPFLHQRMSSIRNCLGIEHIWRGFGYLSSEERRKWSNNGEAREDIARWHWMSQRSDPTLTSGRTSPFKIIILYNLGTTHNWYEVQTEDWVDLNWLDCLHCPMPIHTYCAGLILVKVSCRLGEVWLAKSPPRCHHSLTFDRRLFHLTGWMRAEGVPFTTFGHILCRGCSVVTPPPPSHPSWSNQGR